MPNLIDLNDGKMWLGGPTGPIQTGTAAGVAMLNAADATAQRALLNADASNFCLNPGFENVLIGTHTSAINTLTGSATTKNCQYLGWKLKTNNAADSIVVEDGGANVTGRSQKSVKITTSNVTGVPQLVQYWTAAEHLSSFVAACRGGVLNFAVDVKLGTATANACRLFVTSDGTDGTTTYSSYHGNNTNWERLFVSATIPSDATYVYIGVSFASTATVYYVDNCMAVVTASALTALPYEPRLPMGLAAPPLSSANIFTGLTAPTASVSYVTGVANAALPTYNSSYNALRPAWADRAMVIIDADNGNAAEDFFHVRPNGYATAYYTALARIQVVGKMMSLTGCVVLGADGELQVLCSHGDVDGYVSVIYWHGEGL